MRPLLKLATIGACTLAVSPLAAEAEPSAGPALVVLVRHAEPTGTSGDPGLSEAGRKRAEALASALRFSNISAIFTSTLRRTRDTAQPVAGALAVAAVAVDGGGPDQHIAALAAAVRNARRAVLVVGHRDTVPKLIGALDGPQLDALCDVHGRMYLLSAAGGKVHLVRAQFGAAESDPGPNCP